MSVGGFTYETFIHEIGHAIGLSHPHDRSQGTGLFPGATFRDSTDTGTHDLNTTLNTIMSYNDPARPPNDDFGMIATPMAFDIAAIQALYGANTDANAGHTTYVLPDASIAGTFYSCIWDTGGTDRIIYSGGLDATIDLRPATLREAPGGGGFLSSVAGAPGGLTISADFTNRLADRNGETGVIIEHAVGGIGNDTITGNEADNVLSGSAGTDSILGNGGQDDLRGGRDDDTLRGGLGNDLLVGDVLLGLGPGGNDVLDGGAGADVMEGGGGDDTYFVDNAGDVLSEAVIVAGGFRVHAGGIDEIRTTRAFTRRATRPRSSRT